MHFKPSSVLICLATGALSFISNQHFRISKILILWHVDGSRGSLFFFFLFQHTYFLATDHILVLHIHSAFWHLCFVHLSVSSLDCLKNLFEITSQFSYSCSDVLKRKA